MQVRRSKIDLLEGDVIGAAFYEEKGMFVVQQAIPLVKPVGRGTRFHRQLSSWDLKTHSMIAKRVYDMSPPGTGTQAYPCGRVEVSSKLQQIFTCSSETYIEVLDPQNFEAIRKIADRSDQRICDFAVDELRSRVAVLSQHLDGSIRLSFYSMLDGAQQQESGLPFIYSRGLTLALAPKTGQVAVTGLLPGLYSGDRYEVYICEFDKTLSCTSVARTRDVAQSSFLGTQLLLAVDDPDDKKDCILAVDPTTRSVSRTYCSPATGVHYAVGVVNQRYVVGFTGLYKRHWLVEGPIFVSSSFSVWRVENHNVAAIAQDPLDYEYAVGIVTSSKEPFFITYQRTSNALCLYSIVDSK